MQVGFLLCCLVGWVHGSEICVVEDGLRLFGGDDPWWISSGTGGGVSPRCTAVGNGEWRREAVKEAALHAWNGYVDSAWGMDELQPLSMQGVDNFGGMGATIVDSLSTLYVMGLEEEFEKAKEWVAEELDFDQEVIVFETVIRILGGLLSAYHLSGDEVFLEKSEDLAMRLAKCFNSESGYPFPRCELNSSVCSFHKGYGKSVLLAEVGTVQLEFRAISHHTHNEEIRVLREKSERVVQMIRSITPSQNKGLAPFLLDIKTGRFLNGHITLGSPSDSYFEYLLKAWIQGGRQETLYRDMFVELMDGILTYMTITFENGVTVLKDINGSKVHLRMDHFTCYLPGVVIMGLDLAVEEKRKEWFNLAENVTRTCYGMYEWTESGLSAENIEVFEDGSVSFNGGHILRPEVIEAIFYMWRATHDEKYRRWGWNIFQNIQKWCRTENGFATLVQADNPEPQMDDNMPSFFLAETLKYLYLLFSDDDILPLDQWVFNTEGHPLLITPGLAPKDAQ